MLPIVNPVEVVGGGIHQVKEFSGNCGMEYDKY